MTSLSDADHAAIFAANAAHYEWQRKTYDWSLWQFRQHANQYDINHRTCVTPPPRRQFRPYPGRTLHYTYTKWGKAYLIGPHLVVQVKPGWVKRLVRPVRSILSHRQYERPPREFVSVFGKARIVTQSKEYRRWLRKMQSMLKEMRKDEN